MSKINKIVREGARFEMSVTLGDEKNKNRETWTYERVETSGGRVSYILVDREAK